MNFKEKLDSVKKDLNDKYSEISSSFFMFLLENNISIRELREIDFNIEVFHDFTIEKKQNSLLLKKNREIIEISFAFKNTFKKIKKNKVEYDLKSIKEGSVIDIIFIKNGIYYSFLGENKEMVIQSKIINAVYSPSKKDWHALIDFKSEFYNQILIFELPMPQIHYIRKNKDNSFYKVISINDNDFFEVEYYKTKEISHPEIINEVFLCKEGILTPRKDK